MSDTVYVATHEVDSEGGRVIAVCATLDGAKRAVEADRSEPASPLVWGEWRHGDRRTWMHTDSGADWGCTSYEIAEWLVDPGFGSVTITGSDGEPIKGWLYPSPIE